MPGNQSRRTLGICTLWTLPTSDDSEVHDIRTWDQRICLVRCSHTYAQHIAGAVGGSFLELCCLPREETPPIYIPLMMIMLSRVCLYVLVRWIQFGLLSLIQKWRSFHTGLRVWLDSHEMDQMIFCVWPHIKWVNSGYSGTVWNGRDEFLMFDSYQ